MRERQKERRRLFRLADAVVKDVLEASDEEILAEAAESGVDAKDYADKMRAFVRASVGKEKV